MSWLKESASAITHLEGVVIAQLPECVAWDSWSRASWDAEEVAAYFGDMSRAGRNALKTAGTAGDSLRLTLETGDKLVMVEELNSNFVAVYLFEKKIQMGMARLRMRQINKVIQSNLPGDELQERSRAERIMAFLLRYAPDAHAVPMRISLQTGILIDRLNQPDSLTPEETSLLEVAAQNVLGVQQLRI